ncbi:MAG: hypothetical protein ACI8R4_000427 [Paracoccaceae bacterium]|jgi:uncharacterized protein YndB with AHSA1/START domain
MTDLRLERDFAVSPARLFAAVSTRSDLLQWWGQEGMHVPVHDLDLSRTGPWFSVMQNAEGQQFKVSGQVTHVDPPHSLGFTWGWHDDQDHRGSESHVTFTVQAIDGGARLILDHRDLDDSDQSARHETGWTSSLRKLFAHLT